jgi:hypothetical protein
MHVPKVMSHHASSNGPGKRTGEGADAESHIDGVQDGWVCLQQVLGYHCLVLVDVMDIYQVTRPRELAFNTFPHVRHLTPRKFHSDAVTRPRCIRR